MLSRSLMPLVVLLCVTRLLGANATAPSAQQSLSIVVLRPDGHLAKGAMAILVPPGHAADVTDGRSFDDDPADVHATADDKGQLHFSMRPARFLLVVIDPSGCARLPESALADGGVVTLTAWGRIDGERRIGHASAAGRKIIAWNDMGWTDESPGPTAPSVTFIDDAITDAKGRFQLDRLYPGEDYVAVNDAMSWGNVERPLIEFRVEAGKTTAADIGGYGRAVVGRVALPDALSKRNDWSFWLCVVGRHRVSAPSPMPKELQDAPIARQIGWWASFNRTAQGENHAQAERAIYPDLWTHTYPFEINADGTFRIDDVDSGHYDLNFDVITRKNHTGPRLTIAKGHCEFTVTNMAGEGSDVPLQLPPVKGEMVQSVQIGDAAPDFTVVGFDGQPIHLADFRGKFVLLNFWATWCGPCIGEVHELKRIFDRFGADERLVMIGLSADQTPDKPAQFVESQGLMWRQGYLGSEWDSNVEKAYGVEQIPSILIIGPDQRVLQRPRSGELQSAIASLLGK